MTASGTFVRNAALEKSIQMENQGDTTPTNVSIERCIGTGASGSVFQGSILFPDESNESKQSTRIAVKSMKPTVLRR